MTYLPTRRSWQLASTRWVRCPTPMSIFQSYCSQLLKDLDTGAFLTTWQSNHDMLIIIWIDVCAVQTISDNHVPIL